MNRNSIVRVLILGLALLSISVNGHAATQPSCTQAMDLIVDYMSGGRYTSWWIKRETARWEVNRIKLAADERG